MEKTSIVDRVVQSQDKNGMLRRALERIIQLYTDKSHFVYELLQNAEDAGASKIRFEQYVDRLEVQHDGRPFTKDNLQGLCDIGLSDKTDTYNQIGEFGVGFKSVFGICEVVRLYSHPCEEDLNDDCEQFAVEIRDFTNLFKIEDQDIEPGYTTKFVFPYSVGHSFSGFKAIEPLNRKLTNRLQNLGITTLLFMKNLQSINYKINLPGFKSIGSYRLNKKRINDHCSLISAKGQKVRLAGDKTKSDEEISYLVFSRAIEGNQVGRTIDIAFAIKVGEDGKYSFIKANNPNIFVYFPTETESKLNFIVQGPYRTTPNRSSVPFDDIDNINLANQTAELFRDSVIELRDANKLDYDFLNILPLSSSVFENSPLFKCIFSTTKEALNNEALLLCDNGSYMPASSIKIARGGGLAEVLNDNLLAELINDGKDYHWLPKSITEQGNKYKKLYEYLTNELKIEVLRPENLKTFFNANKMFLPERSEDWLIDFYNMYSHVTNAFSMDRAGTNMSTAEIIKTTKGEFVAPYRKSVYEGQNFISIKNKNEESSYRQNVFLPVYNMDEMDDINFVDEEILRECRHFFVETLNLKRPNSYEIFIEDYISRCENDEEISEPQHISDLKNLIHFLEIDDYKDEVTSLIQKYVEVRCFLGGKVVFINPSMKKIYFPVSSSGMSIEQYYFHIAWYPYVDLDFYSGQGVDMDMLKLLGISEDIATGTNTTNGEYIDQKTGRKQKWTTDGEFRWKLSLDKLDDVLQYISGHPYAADSMAKSSFIFRFLLDHESMLTGNLHFNGNKDDITDARSEIISKLCHNKLDSRISSNIKWLFDKSGKLVSQRDITKYDLNTDLYGQIDFSSDLYEILGFRKDKKEQREAVTIEYDQLDDDTKDRYFEIELERRFNITPDDLEDNIKSGIINAAKASADVIQDIYDFPSSKIRNWDSLKKHVAEVLVYACPVKYEYKVRSIRVSRADNEIDAYLQSMYEIEGTKKYACQMCHEPVSRIEKCQISTSMEKELDAMYLCMCPNCASEYRIMRNDEEALQEFLDRIMSLEDWDIESNDPVKIDFDDESIWFTQTHVAEIRELMILKNAADSLKESVTANEMKNENFKVDDDYFGFKENENEDLVVEEVIPGTDVYKELIGKRIYHKSEGYGFVKSCDGVYIEIEFEQGKRAGKVTKYSLEACLLKDLLQFN